MVMNLIIDRWWARIGVKRKKFTRQIRVTIYFYYKLNFDRLKPINIQHA